ncbi:Actin related protein 2/3 complex subunit 5 [Oopsacas minuta]|uniref:Actin-related protein 2/3 complex subunit 5 n=1 Tax=Oopsacas minuta TaxID=111878 RepID=A0AAV7JYD4_9METZ|nr:Actin related protein 2/3 complex subunit 5 [Oopsacas minuta]
MSKKTRSDQFRDADIDMYDEDQYVDDDDTGGDNAAAQLADREGRVRTLISNGNHAGALPIILEAPPTGSKDKTLNTKNISLVLDVLTRFKTAEIEKAVSGLDADQQDNLMKYIYKGFSEGGEKDFTILLSFHEKVYKLGGLGCIMRVLTDRKTL